MTPTRPFKGRKKEIATLIATVIVENGQKRGMSYAEIGEELGISGYTVRSYVREMASMIDGLDVFPPRLRIWMVTKYPEIADSVRVEVLEV